MNERLRTHYSVGSYSRDEIGAVMRHARDKDIGYKLIQGPVEKFPLPDGSDVSVSRDKTAVVLITEDRNKVTHFWDGFQYPTAK